MLRKVDISPKKSIIISYIHTLSMLQYFSTTFRKWETHHIACIVFGFVLGSVTTFVAFEPLSKPNKIVSGQSCSCEPFENDCSDLVDNDDDSFVDCDDHLDCDYSASCESSSSSSAPLTEIHCSDSVDNDEDSFVDCQDHPDCDYSVSCEENCVNEVDDDGDLDVDCDDAWCFEDPACSE